jgi:hypothetical protein
MVGVVVERHEELRGEHDVIAPPPQRLADDDLGLALGVDVGCVDEGDAGVQRPMDDLDAVVVVLGAPVAEHHGAEAECTDRDASAAQRSLFHGVCPSWSGNWSAGEEPDGQRGRSRMVTGTASAPATRSRSSSLHELMVGSVLVRAG